jgi:hypothetical protein
VFVTEGEEARLARDRSAVAKQNQRIEVAKLLTSLYHLWESVLLAVLGFSLIF